MTDDSNFKNASQLVTVGHYTTPVDAELNRIKLEAAGIPAFIADQFLTGLNPLLGTAVGARVQVPVEFADSALDMLRQHEPAQVAPEDDVFDFMEGDGAEEEEYDDFSAYCDTCPKCDSPKIRRKIGIVPLVLMILMPFGHYFALAPTTYQRWNWRCKECGHSWRAPYKAVGKNR